VWAVCQLGAEPALKAEVATLSPGWRFAYSRPGLVTWKTDAPVGPEVALGAVFARAWGASIGKAADDAAIVAAAATLGKPPILQVIERDRARPGEEAEGDRYGPLADEARARLVAAAPAGTFVPEARLPRPGELVLDVIVAPGEPAWVGCHVHVATRSPHPGGRAPLVLPPEAPSRAWLKLEEALAWSQLRLARGQVAVEIGSAPGGASWALLSRGLTVIGVDPGDMDARVLAAPGFSHLKLPLGDLRREQLPARVDWLLMDVNLAPQVAVHGVRRIVSTLRGSLRGVVFTLKLNDWKMAAEVPALVERVAGMGLAHVRATQLPSNRREICVTGIHEKAKGRP
jgi:23S rRNA (cytidine2498-2'-O)-methyltransferase